MSDLPVGDECGRWLASLKAEIQGARSAFAEICPEGPIGQQAAAQLPWFHLVTLKVPDPSEREWCATQIVRALPEPLDTNLQSMELIEKELRAVSADGGPDV